MNEGAAGVSKKSHAGDNRGIPPFKKQRVGAPGLSFVLSPSGLGSQYDWATQVVAFAQQVRFVMLFRCTFEVKGLANRLAEAEGLEFRFENPRSIVIRLSKNYPDNSKPTDPSDMVGISTTSAEITDTKIASELVAGLSASLDGRWANLKGADPSTVAFLQGTVDELQAVMSSTIAHVRWRDGLAEGPPEAYHNSKGYYSEDGNLWRELSMARRIELRWGIAYGQMTPAKELCKEVVELRNAGAEEPLGHQLFREAWNHRMLRPRSALVIGVAAAEVGFKKLVGSLVPQAQWLLDEGPTPSLSIMLRKFLPTLKVKARFEGKSIRPPGKLLKKLEDAVSCRNDLVHAGKAPPTGKELDEMLNAILDLLWICDLYGGHVWAGRHVSAWTMSIWENEKTR
jgi:hypothetical protein